MDSKTDLPIYSVMDEIHESIRSSSRLVLQAPPGAGKTTCIPLELLKEPWLNGKKIIMLEPRRIAARNAAYWMSSILGENIGDSVGYTVHLDSKVSSKTVIEVVTEGVFLNRLLNDPELDGIAMVIFDEFHERSLEADLSLALIKETQEVLREDLKVLVMSATLDAEPVAQFLDQAPIITSRGKSFPVDIQYLSQPDLHLIKHVTNTVIDVINSEVGSILVFLPGVGEIRRVLEELKSIVPEDIVVQPLYSGLSREDQERAIEPVTSGLRKVVLATSIAESSITIKGVRVVIDSGLIRKPQYNPKNGMNTLVTQQVSKASADQRAGRAGRVEPGVCYRLWESYKTLEVYDTPEIISADFSSGLLSLAKWGYTNISDIEWLTPPNNSIYRSSLELLTVLGAVDSSGITKRGEKISRLPFHPRLASMITLSNSRSAVTLAALLSEKDILNFPQGQSQCDLRYRLEALEGREIIGSKKQFSTIKRVREIIKSVKVSTGLADLSELLLTAYPDRVAKRSTQGSYYMSNGTELSLSTSDSLYSSEYLVVTNSGGLGRGDKIYMAYPVTEEEIFIYCSSRVETVLEIEFQPSKAKFSGVNRVKLGHLVLKESRTADVTNKEFHTALLNYLKKDGLTNLNWTKDSVKFRERINFLHSHFHDEYPDFSEDTLSNSLDWLEPYIGGMTIKSSLKDIPLLEALKGHFSWNELQEIEEYAPTHYTVPSGSKVPIDYSTGEPIIKVRLQELFGLFETPMVLKGSIPITFHLLSPASRPIQITKDLRSFWETTYSEVKKDLKGRYPKHYWPEDPLTATPTNRVKPRLK